MKKFLCKGKYSRYAIAGILGLIAGGLLGRATGLPIPGLTLALIGTYVFRSTQCKLPKKRKK